MEPNRRAIKARTGFLKDPTLIDQQKAAAESSMLGEASGAGDRPGSRLFKPKLCKETLPVELWGSNKIGGTPYGSFAKFIDSKKASEAAGGATSKVANATMRSSVTFDDFTFPVGKAAVDAEMPRGKRTQPINAISNPSKIFDPISEMEMKLLF